jgi:hypothetical protein
MSRASMGLEDSVAMLASCIKAPISRAADGPAKRLLERLVRHPGAACLDDVLRGRDATVPAPDVPPCDEFVSNVITCV